MKTMKRLLAGALALTMTLAFASCGGDSNGGSSSSDAGGKELSDEAKEQIAGLQDQLPDIELENKTIKWMAHYDINPSEGSVKSAGLELFEQKYGGKVEYMSTIWENRYDDLATAVMGGKDSPDFFPASDMDSFPFGAIKGMFQPLDDYIDFNSDIWASTKTAADKFMYAGGHYVAVVDVSPNYVCVYNKTTIETNGFDDPAELFANDEWTWDEFGDMCTSFADPDNDIYGLDGYWYGNAISETSGVPLIGMSDDGLLVNNMSDPNVEKAQDFMYELGKNNVMFDRSSNDWKTRGDGTEGTGLGTYQTLFIPIGLWGIQQPLEKTAPFGDMEEGEIMFVPMPRNPDSDTYYISSRVEGYHLCKGASNPEGVAAYLNCLMVTADGAAQITEDVWVNDYKWNQEMIDMYHTVHDLAKQNPVFDFQNAVSSELKTVMEKVSQATMITGGGATTWTQARTENETSVDILLEEVNEKIQSGNAG